MKKKSNRLISSTLSAAMILNGMASAVYAVEQEPVKESPAESEKTVKESDVKTVEEDVKTDQESEKSTDSEKQDSLTTTKKQNISEDFSNFTVNADDVNTSSVISDSNAAVVGEGNVDKSDPVIRTIEEELNTIVVKDEQTGEKVKLTEEQIQQVLGMYAQYQQFQAEHADVLGVQLPFFLSYNDNEEDGLGILGEMLVLSNVSVEDVRNGDYSFDDLTGMIMTFMYADQFGVNFYGEKVRAQRDNALEYVKNSGAVTEEQKLLVLNDWLTTQASFDMSYIMNTGKETPVMVAQNPQQHQYYQVVYDEVYKVYQPQIEQQFHDQVYQGVESQLKSQFYQNAILSVYSDQILKQLAADPENPTDEEKAAANEQAQQIMEADQEAISSDPEKYVEDKFGAEAAGALKAQCDGFLENAASEGLDVAGDGNLVTTEQLTQQTMENEKIMDLDGDGTPETTANQAIGIFSQAAADQVTQGVLNYWKGSQFGTLAEGEGVCLGYSKAYAYLVQAMHPEIYTKDGKDLDTASNWKSTQDLYYDEEGNLDINKDYAVDMVRISFQADVTMFGETQEGFNSDHFWNAVKVNGKWYYVDPCYTDTFSEVMIRDRVETDGFINHMYFLFSHDSTTALYEGYYSEIKTLYADAATDKTYEDSWIARAKSFVTFDGNKAYYVYDSTDLIDQMNDYNNNNSWSTEDARLKLVAHTIDDSDAGNGDEDYTTLIDFNAPVDGEDGTVAKVLDAEGNLVENELLTELFAEHKALCDIYPSINITSALKGNKLFFNLSKYILSYDLETSEVQIHKSYDEVNGKRDLTKAFGGEAFSLVNSANDADFTFTNHPIAGMVLKPDGNLHVAIATNLGYISGKDDLERDITDGNNYTADSAENGYGYAFEETNYNPNYSSYNNRTYDDSVLEQFGYTKEINDNDEFMWVTNFNGVENLDALAAAQVEYTALECGHHWVESNETYFTKDSEGNWNKGTAYICVKCGAHVSDPGEEPERNQFNEDRYDELKADYDKKKAAFEEAKENAGHLYTAVDPVWSEDNSTVTISKLSDSECESYVGKLDVFQDDKDLTVTLKEAETFETESVTTGECDKGTVTVFSAKGKTKDGYRFEVSKTVNNEPGKHPYEAEWTWSDDATEASVTLTCPSCGHTVENLAAEIVLDEEASVPSTCLEEGKDVYVATAVLKDEEGNVVDTFKSTKNIALPKEKHNLSMENVTFTWNGYESATAEAVCSNQHETLKASKVTITKDEEKSVKPTPTTEGKNVLVATAVFEEEDGTVIATFTDVKEEEVAKIGTTPMYRLYNPNSGEHFYTANPSERQMLVDKGWTYEQIGWYAPTTSNTPVYRMYNPNAGDHHYTASAGERDVLKSKGWTYEGIGWYSCDEQEVPLYRQYNPNAKAGAHNYTTNKAENDMLVSKGWQEEGIGWYGCKQ